MEVMGAHSTLVKRGLRTTAVEMTWRITSPDETEGGNNPEWTFPWGENEKEQSVCLLVGSFPILLESMLKICGRYLENQAKNEAIFPWENNNKTKQKN